MYFIYNPERLPRNRRLRRKPRTLTKAIESDANSNGARYYTGGDYSGADRVILYGWGGECQQRIIQNHSGSYAALDLGYWSRDGFYDRKWRVSINGFHCPDLIMLGEAPPNTRCKREGISAINGRKTKNVTRILLVGTAPKSQAVGARGWTAKKSKELKKQFPNAEIIYRPKPDRQAERGVYCHTVSRGAGIESVLNGVDLVVCRHSNVAVDACIMGVPVVCDDGAAAAIYPSRLCDWERQPCFELRSEFLTRLSWWQWTIREIQSGGFWEWLEGRFVLAENMGGANAA